MFQKKLIYFNFWPISILYLDYYFNMDFKGIARTQSPTNKNDAFKLPTFGVIVRVSSTEVQWKSLTLEEPPS